MAGHTPLLPLTQLLILPCCVCGGEKKWDMFELITTDSPPEGSLCLLLAQ